MSKNFTTKKENKEKFSSDDEKQITMSRANIERVFVPLGTFVTFGYKSKVELTGLFVPQNDGK